MNTIEQSLCDTETTLTLNGHGRQYLYQFSRVDSDGSAHSTHFVRFMMPHGWQYLGVYQPLNGWLLLTRASRMESSHEAVRALRWVLGRIWAEDAAGIENGGFTLEFTKPAQPEELADRDSAHPANARNQ
jgi:hypothetical protein